VDADAALAVVAVEADVAAVGEAVVVVDVPLVVAEAESRQ
jgi:hypothetical protein